MASWEAEALQEYKVLTLKISNRVAHTGLPVSEAEMQNEYVAQVSAIEPIERYSEPVKTESGEIQVLGIDIVGVTISRAPGYEMDFVGQSPLLHTYPYSEICRWGFEGEYFYVELFEGRLDFRTRKAAIFNEAIQAFIQGHVDVIAGEAEIAEAYLNTEEAVLRVQCAWRVSTAQRKLRAMKAARLRAEVDVLTAGNALLDFVRNNRALAQKRKLDEQIAARMIQLIWRKCVLRSVNISFGGLSAVLQVMAAFQVRSWENTRGRGQKTICAHPSWRLFCYHPPFLFTV
jgi:hypothetical protein